MRGLLLKDLFVNKWNFIINIGLFIITFINFLSVGKAGSGNLYYSLIAVPLLVNIIGTSINIDKISNSDKYLMTMPISKRTIIIEKYFLVFLPIIIGAIIGSLIILVVSNIGVLSIIRMDIILIPIFSMIAFIAIPLGYKFGNKATGVYSAIMIIPAMLLAAPLTAASGFTLIGSNLLMIYSLVIGIVVSIFLYLISMYIYRNSLV